MIKAILFDLDGVIVDSLHFHHQAWNKKFTEMGGREIKLETVLMHEGRNSFEILPILMEESGVTIPEDERKDWIEEKRKYFRSIAKLKHYPNAFETIGELRKRGYKTALVTACAKTNMCTAVNEEQQKNFDFIVTAEDVERAKPNPDPYLTAQRKLGFEINECVVVENAPLGIQAAKTAGMVCIAVESTLGREYLQRADFVINEIQELTGFFPVLKR